VENLKNIFQPSSQCISTEKIQDYLLNKLSENEKRQVEMHLTDCEICNDQLEGLQILNSTEKLKQIENELNTKIDHALKNKTKTNKKNIFINKKPVYLSIAALLLMLIGINIFLYFNNINNPQNSSLAYDYSMEEKSEKVDFSPESEQTKLNSSDSAFVSPNRSLKHEKEKSFEKPINLKEKEVFEDYIAPDTNALITSKNSKYNASDNKSASSEITVFEDIEADLVSDEVTESQMEEQKNESLTGNTSRNKKQSPSIDNLQQAENLYNAKKFQESLQMLDSLKFQNQSKNYYQSMWLKALNYIELKEIEKAKTLLKELAVNKNDYQNKAEKKLKNLK
jgi:hypothetical protein